MIKAESKIDSGKPDYNYVDIFNPQQNVQRPNNDGIADAFESFRNTSTFNTDAIPPRTSRLLFKTPLTENFAEFENLEFNLTKPDYNKRMVDELCRFKGNCLQSSLSSMLTQLVSRTLLRQFCFKGSKGNNSSGIQKRPFKHTLTYAVITGNDTKFKIVIDSLLNDNVFFAETLKSSFLYRDSFPDF